MTIDQPPAQIDVPAADGAVLASDYYRHTEPRGTVLIRTPYGRANYAAQASAWHREGFDVVVQDVRGRYGSSGTWHPYENEGPDGAAAARHLCGSPDFRGPLILAGASYDAHCALEAARTMDLDSLRHAALPRPAAVVAMVPALGRYETARDPGGEPRLWDRIGWWHMHGFGRVSAAALAGPELEARCAKARLRGVKAVVSDAEYGPGAVWKWEQLWNAPKQDLAMRYGRMRTPLLVVSGERDFFPAEALELASYWACGKTGLLWGPWGHGLAADLTGEQAAALRAGGGILPRIRNWLEAAKDGGLNPDTWVFHDPDGHGHGHGDGHGHRWTQEPRHTLRRSSTPAAGPTTATIPTENNESIS